MEKAIEIIFYINTGMVFFLLAMLAIVGLLASKTRYAGKTGIVTMAVFGVGFVMFVVQLVLYSMHHTAAPYLVITGLATMYVGFIFACVYYILLGKRSNKVACILTGIMMLIPPVGLVFSLVLSKKMRTDTHAQALVYHGYAYTYAAISGYCAGYRPEFVDSADDESLPKLNKKQLKQHLAKLKSAATTPQGEYEYAVALVNYTDKQKEALKHFNGAARNNYIPALFNLGYFYEIGLFVKKDLKKAKELYTRAADEGDSEAAIRLGILMYTNGNAAGAAELFRDRADKNDMSAKFNYALCLERGIGVDRDLKKSIELYGECANAGFYAAQKRLFVFAGDMVNKSAPDIPPDLLLYINSLDIGGEYGSIHAGMLAVKNKRASDAAKHFLDAVKKRGKWEGLARLLVGTLYLDRGKLEDDRNNGAAYIKSAVGSVAVAEEIFLILPKRFVTKTKKQPPPEKYAGDAPKAAVNDTAEAEEEYVHEFNARFIPDDSDTDM